MKKQLVAGAMAAGVSLAAAAAVSTASGSKTTATTPVTVVAAAATVMPIPTPTPTASTTAKATAAAVVATPAAATTTAYKKAVYIGNYPADLVAYELWLGKRTDGVQLHTGRAGWGDWGSSIGWLVALWKGVDRPIYWSIPLIAQGATLADAGAGKYNSNYVAAARTLAQGYPNASKIYVRTGWEFNGDWQPWAAKGKEAQYRAAYRQFVASFRSVSGRFVFEWTPNNGDLGMNPENAYPGDDVVDIIGMDFYYNHQWDPADGAKAFAYHRDEKYGLAWHQAFAKLHKKPTAYAEWGVSKNSDASYVQAVGDWFATHNIVYASYWNSNAAYQGKLSDNQYPAVSTAYRALVLK
ncbi:MAG: glycosyl hydrolase [Sphingomonas phyllosphaerae]|uniref:glycosyl hydrolase n=1 Tax=Sphingomonas phyllosphaerae TaxID=257003 RepID=UPI002FFD2A3F